MRGIICAAELSAALRSGMKHHAESVAGDGSLTRWRASLSWRLLKAVIIVKKRLGRHDPGRGKTKMAPIMPSDIRVAMCARNYQRREESQAVDENVVYRGNRNIHLIAREASWQIERLSSRQWRGRLRAMLCRLFQVYSSLIEIERRLCSDKPHW